MPWSKCIFIKRITEFTPKKDITDIPPNTRGIYALLKQTKKNYNVVYIGLSAGVKAGVRGRLKAHNRNPKKARKWTHFTIFEVHDNITNDQIHELEGLLRHIYRKDLKANSLAKQLSYKKFKKLPEKNLNTWKKN